MPILIAMKVNDCCLVNIIPGVLPVPMVSPATKLRRGIQKKVNLSVQCHYTEKSLMGLRYPGLGHCENKQGSDPRYCENIEQKKGRENCPALSAAIL